MSNLFEELKRRNVVRVGLAYMVIGWVVLQVIDTLVPLLEVPEWVGKAVLIFLIAGLPLALFFSWAYELTPQGVKKTAEVDADASITHSTGHKLDRMIIAALVVALGYFIWERQAVEPAAQALPSLAESERATIAVLPFVNMSNDPEQEFFSDGISEEILNVLVRERSLKVVSRTSAFSFKGQNLDIPTIAKRLGAAYVVEGSVRRAGDTLRITAQLIEAASDTHLWSATYDRPYRDVFAVQEEIGNAISAALGQSLGFTASAKADAGRMEDLAAYEDFLRARTHLRAREVDEAVRLFESVVEREPGFAPAWAFYSISLDYLRTVGFAESSEMTSGGAVLFMARGAARRAFGLAPDDATTQYALGLVARAEGRYLEELAHYEKALEADPDNALVLEDFVQTLNSLKVGEDMAPYVERLVGADPLWMVVRIVARIYDARINGDLESSVALYDELVVTIPGAFFVHGLRIRSLLIMRRWDEAIAAQTEARQSLSALSSRPGFLDLDIGAIRDWVEDPGRGSFLQGPLAVTYNKSNDSFLEGIYVAYLDDPDEIFALAMNANLRTALGTLGVALKMESRHFLLDDPRMKEFILRTERRWDIPWTEVWRNYGWPHFCRPLGDDDFECGVFD